MMNQIDLSRLDLNLLVLFEMIFDERHLGRAADRLSLSPSAVSHGLGRLRRLLNDPLFTRTPKGVVPTDRATALAPAIAEVLLGVRAVIAHAEPFDAATSTRRMVIGAPDGVSAVLLKPLLDRLRSRAPGIDIGIRQLLPVADEMQPERAWRETFRELETPALDIAVIPLDYCPARFEKRTLYEEDFVLAMRAGHPFLASPTLDSYCASRHLVVSLSGDARGFVDEALAAHGRARRVALTAPNFMFACAIVAESDFICAVPRRFAALYAQQFGFSIAEPPFPLGSFRLNAFAPKAALIDAGVGWLFDQIADVGERLTAS